MTAAPNTAAAPSPAAWVEAALVVDGLGAVEEAAPADEDLEVLGRNVRSVLISKKSSYFAVPGAEVVAGWVVATGVVVPTGEVAPTGVVAGVVAVVAGVVAPVLPAVEDPELGGPLRQLVSAVAKI